MKKSIKKVFWIVTLLATSLSKKSDAVPTYLKVGGGLLAACICSKAWINTSKEKHINTHISVIDNHLKSPITQIECSSAQEIISLLPDTLEKEYTDTIDMIIGKLIIIATIKNELLSALEKTTSLAKNSDSCQDVKKITDKAKIGITTIIHNYAVLEKELYDQMKKANQSY